MKTILFISLLSSIVRLNATAQDIVPHAEFGMSLGTGYGFDLGLGRVTQQDPFHEYGIVYLLSVYVPYFGKHDPDGEEGYFNWFAPTTQVTQSVGISAGVRYVFDRYSLGMMADWRSSTTYQNYVSTVTGLTRHTAGVDSYNFGVTLTSSVKVDENWGISIFAGTQRTFMVGALYLL